METWLTLRHKRSRTRLVHLEKAPLLRPLEPAAGPGLAEGDPLAPDGGPMKDGLDAKPLLVAAISPFSCFDAPKLPMKAEPPLLLPTCKQIRSQRHCIGLHCAFTGQEE